MYNTMRTNMDEPSSSSNDDAHNQQAKEEQEELEEEDGTITIALEAPFDDGYDDYNNTINNNNNSNRIQMMESIVRITLAGLGGSIIGLSVEKRLEAMRVTTAASLTAAARRKRSPLSPMATSKLVLTPSISWGLSCMMFCAIIETCRLTSPATWLFGTVQNILTTMTLDGENVGRTRDGQLLQRKEDEDVVGPGTNITTMSMNTSMPIPKTMTQTTPPPTGSVAIKAGAITITDYMIGGAMAGVAGSYGRRIHFHNSIAKLHGNKPFIGFIPGISLGVMAGCVQAIIDYGTILAERGAATQHQSP